MSSYKPPVFVVSTGRAGSKMLARVLAYHPDIAAFHEPRPHLNGEAFAHWQGSHEKDKIRSQIETKRTSFIEQVRWNRSTYVESSHFCSHLVEYLYELYGARFIHLYRDGRDFVRSGLEREWWYNEFSWTSSHGLSGRDRILMVLRRQFLWDIGYSYSDHRLVPPGALETRLEKISWLWAEINRVILESLQELPAEHKMSVCLEDFDRDQLSRILTFIGGDGDREDTRHMMAIAERKPNKTGDRSVPPYEQWDSHEKERFAQLTGEMMDRLGYEMETESTVQNLAPRDE